MIVLGGVDSKIEYIVDSVMYSGNEATKVLRDGVYIKNSTNSTVKNINEYVAEDSNYLGSKQMNGEYIYIVDMNDDIIIGTRNGKRKSKRYSEMDLKLI